MNRFFPADIGIIGGGDGPTAIFVSGGGSVLIWAGMGLLAAAACFWVYRFYHKKKRK
ncbi:MAG: hypothetical protein ACI4I8_07330 [Oscillospiraceae bacterium]